MKKYNSVGILLIAVVVAGGVVLLMKGKQKPQPAKLDARFQFLGLTNLGPETYASFQLSNRTDEQLAFVARDFQFKNADGSWQTNGSAGFLKWRGFGDNLLEAHQEIVFQVLIPTNGVPWKLRVTCQEHETGLSRAKEKVDEVVHNTKKEFKARPPGVPAVKSIAFAGRRYDVMSEEISQ